MLGFAPAVGGNQRSWTLAKITQNIGQGITACDLSNAQRSVIADNHRKMQVRAPQILWPMAEPATLAESKATCAKQNDVGARFGVMPGTK